MMKNLHPYWAVGEQGFLGVFRRGLDYSLIAIRPKVLEALEIALANDVLA